MFVIGLGKIIHGVVAVIVGFGVSIGVGVSVFVVMTAFVVVAAITYCLVLF